jgi:hypothetical protein
MINYYLNRTVKSFLLFRKFEIVSKGRNMKNPNY